MRTHIFNVVDRYMQKDKNIILLLGDIGYNSFNNIIDKYNDRVFNVGISEQSIASIAAGLAINGKRPIFFSSVNFATLRCLEQIRNEICFINADVKIIVVGAGFSYSQLGMSHQGTEDIGIMNSLPNMFIYSPSDPLEAEKSIEHALSHKQPSYIRIEKNNENIFNNKINNITLPNSIHDGNDILILSNGSITESLKNDKRFDKYSLYDLTLLNPLNERALCDICKKYNKIITVEEQNNKTGFGNIIASCLYKNKIFKDIKCFGLNNQFVDVAGDRVYLRKKYNIDNDSIFNYLNG